MGLAYLFVSFIFSSLGLLPKLVSWQRILALQVVLTRKPPDGLYPVIV